MHAEPRNMKIKWGKAVVKLADQNQRVALNDGAEIWVKQRPGTDLQPMVTLPDGYKDTETAFKTPRPKVISVTWEWVE